MSRGRVLSAVLAVGVAGSLWFGQAPPRSPGSYGEQGQQTAALLLSQTQTARLWLAARGQGRVTDPATSVALEEAEADAETTLSRFLGYDVPSPASASLRGQVVSAGSAAVAALSRARIAAHGGSWDRMSSVDQQLAAVQTQLKALGPGAES